MSLTAKQLEQLQQNGKCCNRQHPELDAHKLVVKHIRAKYPGAHIIISPIVGSVINRSDRIKHWGVMKAMGYEKGTPDMFIPVPRAEFHGLFIEMKSLKAKAMDTDSFQNKFIRDMISMGYCAVVCYGEQEAIKYIDKYMESRRCFQECI